MGRAVKTLAFLLFFVFSMYIVKVQIIRNPTVPGFHIVNTTHYTNHYPTKDPFVNLIVHVRSPDLLFYTTLTSLMLVLYLKNSVVKRIVYGVTISCLTIMFISDLFFGNPFINLPELYVHLFRRRSLIGLKIDRPTEVGILHFFLNYYVFATIVALSSIVYLLLKFKCKGRDQKLFKQLLPIPIVTLLCSISVFSPIFIDITVLYLTLLSILIVFTALSLSCR